MPIKHPIKLQWLKQGSNHLFQGVPHRSSTTKTITVALILLISISIVFSCDRVWKKDIARENILVDIQVLNKADAIYTLYITSDQNKKFNEINKFYVNSTGKPGWQTVSFTIPAIRVLDKIRIDIDTTADYFKIDDIRIQGKEEKTLKLVEILKSQFIRINPFDDDNGEITLYIEGNDPHFILPEKNIKTVSKITQYSINYYLAISTFIIIILLTYNIYLVTFKNKYQLTLNKNINFRVKGFPSALFTQPCIFIVSILTILILPSSKLTDNLYSTEENRSLATKPTLLKNSGLNTTYGMKFEEYFNDHFNGRNYLINIRDKIDQFIDKGRIENKLTILGSDDWFFLKQDNALESCQNRNKFNDQDLKIIDTNLRLTELWLKKLGVAFFLFIPPDKCRVYSEFFPKWINRVNEQTRLQQVENYFKKTHNPIKLINPLEILKDSKNRLLYFKGDSHWNSYGAFLGGKQLVQKIKNDFPEITIVTENDFRIVDYKAKKGQTDLIIRAPITENEKSTHINKTKYPHPALKNGISYKVKYSGSDFPGHHYTENPEKQLNVLVIHDSFMTALGWYLSESFKKVYFLHQRKSLNFLKLQGFIQNEKIDLIIYESVERKTSRLKKSFFPISS